jgi:hypothetical protein
MRRLQSSVLLVAVLIATPTFTWGQGDACYDAYLQATYDGAAMQLLLSVGNRNFGPMICRGNAVAFDVFRKTLGYECGSEERVTDEPLAWPVTADPVFEVGFTDPDVTSDTAYRYEARAVDAERNPAQGIMPPFGGSVWGYGVVGVALLAHAQLFWGDNFTLSVNSCPGECFADGLVRATPELPLGTTLLLYGNRVDVDYQSNLWWPLLVLTSTSPAPCIVAVEPARWSTVKRLYK